MGTLNPLHRRLVALACVLLALAGLAAAWAWSPLREWLDVGRVIDGIGLWGERFGPLAAIAGFACALSVAVPLTFLILVALAAFGPAAGFAYSLAGACLGAMITYALGRALGHEVLVRLGGERVNQVSRRLADRGLIAVIALRLVPVAPFAIVNMVAGTSHIRLRDMVLGTAIGMIPSTLAMMLFVDQIVRAIREPGPLTVLLAVLTIGLIGIGGWAARRWLGAHPQDKERDPASG